MMFLRSEKADAELIGHVIILGLTITGIGLISVVGVPTIFKLQDMAVIRNVEQTYTLLDSRASGAIMGSSPLQTVDMNLGGGTLTVVPNGTAVDNRSYMVINSTNFNFTIPMGKLKYRLGDRIIAYEGGGVWSKYPSGGSVMLSPPEFHYNGWTLTLPIVNLRGTGSTGGKGTASISFRNTATVQLYPNASNPDMVNPVNGSKIGKVYVNITSEFYDAWAEYAKSLVYTKVVTNSTTRTANIELQVVPNTLGRNNPIKDPTTLRGIDSANSTPLENFSFHLKIDDNNLNWDLRAKSGNKTLVFYVKGTSLHVGDTVSLSVGYQHDYQGYMKPAEIWTGGTFIVKQDGDDEYVDVNLLNTSINLTYNSDTVGSNQACPPATKISSGSFNGTGTCVTTGNCGGFSWTDIPFTGTTKKSLYNITQHYIQLMALGGDVSFRPCGPPSGLPDSESTMIVDYETSGALTYLDITRNDVNVSLT